MPLVEYINHNSHTVQLLSPDKTKLTVGPHQKIILSDWYGRYSPKYLKFVRYADGTQTLNRVAKAIPIKKPIITSKINANIKSRYAIQHRPQVKPIVKATINKSMSKASRHAVGRRAKGQPQVLFESVAQHIDLAFSNNIGIGILSYNRLASLQRLINSIRQHTNLKRTTVFVSDDNSDGAVKQWLSNQNDLIVINNNKRLGVAGNTNRLLRCLSRFKHKFILNDDIEIRRNGWEQSYISAAVKTGIHHFCFRQPGVYGASRGIANSVNGVIIDTVTDKPHGALLYLDDIAFNKVGYFDESYEIYGMEHVDYSNRISLSGIQRAGYHDIAASETYFTIHDENSAIEMSQRTACLRNNKIKFEQHRTNNNRIYCNATNESVVPAISVVIPYRNTFRNDSLSTVIANIKAMRYPDIDIIVAEQDDASRIPPELQPITHIFIPSVHAGQHFNKSKAFNTGVMKAKNNKVILHDADMITQHDYVRLIDDLLNIHESIHIGKAVYYLDDQSTRQLNTSQEWLKNSHSCERIVGYYEGGSLGIQKSAYIKVGGFNEDFIGYGCEDCCFFKRISEATKFNGARSIDLFHLYHGRVPGWDECHKNNKILYDKNFAHGTQAYVNRLNQILRQKYGV